MPRRPAAATWRSASPRRWHRSAASRRSGRCRGCRDQRVAGPRPNSGYADPPPVARADHRRKEGAMHGQVEPRRAIDLPSWLAYLYAPILPYIKRIKVARAGPRGHNPRDILLPAGYVAEVVAAGFNTPVHCTFDDRGYCYVVEGGHKVEAKPRILMVDV